MTGSAIFLGWGHLVVLVLATAASLFLLAWPVFRRYPDDRGDGMAMVLLPSPKLPAAWKALVFGLIFTVINIVLHSVKGDYDPNHLYAVAVQRLAATTVRAPSELNGYFANFDLGLRVLVFGTIISLSLVCRGNGLRRLIIASQVLWYLLATLMFDALSTVLSVLFGLPVAPTTLFANFLALGLGFLAMARLLYVNFALPKPTAVPFVPRPRLGGIVMLVSCTVSAMALCAAGVLYLYHIANPHLRALLVLLAPIPFGYGAVLIRSGLLFMLNKFSSPPEPAVGSDRPPIEIIIPAYNEEEVIGDTLRAIDVAAGRYGGPVNVILSNDGSTDATKAIATDIMTNFAHATGRIIDVNHGGKSATLNAALAETTAELIIRIDADTIIGEWAFYYMPRWFRDPSVGLVEALMWPRWRRSVFPHMRLFEELKQFGMLHRTVGIVDGINVVPGVFTGFRRQPAIDLGGFTQGMNGEDGDFTLRMSRLGWQIKQDPRMTVYEDVPPKYWEIREQRVRWDRATLHNQARHGPYRAGLATPKVWFSQTHQFFSRTFAPIRLMLPLYLLVLAMFKGIYITPLLLAVAAWFVGQASFMAFEVILAVAYRHERQIGWVLLWPLWQIALIIFSTESWLSLPGRPASLLHGSAPAEIRTAVVH